MKNIDLSIIILSYKSKDDLERLLPNIYASEGINFGSPPPNLPHQGGGKNAEVIIVDNGSNDGTLDWLQATCLHLPSARVDGGQASYQLQAIRNINNGFAAGNNIGIRHSNGKYILLLNPDTKVEPNTFEVMLDFMENNLDAGISGCKVVKPNNELDLACRRRFPNPWNSFLRLFLLSKRNYNKLDSNENEIQEVDSVMGAFLLIRKSVIDAIGLLDEDFFMYGEDIDWCWRSKEAGFKVWYYPKTKITHYKGSSSKKIPTKALVWFHDSMWIFYKKHYFKKYPFFLNWIVWLGVKLRLYLLLGLNLFKKEKIVSK